jgi:hypothetical protein
MKKFFVHDADLVQYAMRVIGRNLCSVPGKALERIISKDEFYSVDYAIHVVKGRWEPCEATISKDAYQSLRYARDAVKGRWEPGEEAISKCGASSLDYARYVIKGSWEMGEDAISSSTEYMYLYAKDVIGGRLPDSLHNKMVLAGSDEWTKKYFKAKKYRRLKKAS